MRIRNDPVTVIASKLHNVTEVYPWEDAASVEHKSGDLLILCVMRFLRVLKKAQRYTAWAGLVFPAKGWCVPFLFLLYFVPVTAVTGIFYCKNPAPGFPGGRNGTKKIWKEDVTK